MALALRASAAHPADALAPSPEAHALATERRSTLLQAIDRLRDEERLIIAYRYLFDLSEAETAAALECPRGTVKSRLARALRRLRDELGDLGESDRLDSTTDDAPQVARQGGPYG